MESTPPVHIQQSAPNLGAQIQKQIQSGGVEGFAKMMESILIQQLLQQMNKSLVNGALFGHSHQAKMYQGMFTETFAETLADSGGIGLAKIITRQLQQKFLNSPVDNDKITTETMNDPQDARGQGHMSDLQAFKYQVLLNREGIKENE